MKHILILAFALPSFLYSFGQSPKDTTNLTEEAALNSASKGACDCINTIALDNKSSHEISLLVDSCIKPHVNPYNLTLKMIEAVKGIKDKKNISINYKVNESSNEFISAYQRIQARLMDSCDAIKIVSNVNNKVREKSYTENPMAMEEYKTGNAYRDGGDFENAIDHYERAVKLDPQFTFAWDNLGVCYRKTNQFQKALDAYNASLKIEPKGELPLHNIPVVYEYLKDYDKALEAYRNISAVHPDDPEAHFGVGRIYTFYKVDLVKGLESMCKAYNKYVELKSPYRSDAEKIINYIYEEMKKAGKEKDFIRILEENHIRMN